MKKVLLVGSSFNVMPLLKVLRNADIEVVVCGIYKNDPLHQYADDSIYADYSIKEDLLEVLKNNQFDAIVPTCNDYSYISCSWVASQLGFGGFEPYEITKTIHEKDDFRKFCNVNGIKSPQMFSDSTDVKEQNYPLIVKPIDSFSGKGISTAKTPEELDVAIERAKRASRTNKIIIEEFKQGTLHAITVFIENGKAKLSFVTDEFCSVYPYQVNSTCMSFLSEDTKENIFQEIAKIVYLLDLKSGLMHVQFLVDGENFWIIECTRRAPGDLYGKLIKLTTGIDYDELYVNNFLGKTEVPKNEYTVDKIMSKHTLTTDLEGVIESITFKIPCHNTFIPLKNSCDVIKSAPFDRAGIVFSEYQTNEELKKTIPEIHNLIEFNYYA